MRYRNLGSTGLQVSVIGLGTNNFGRKLDEKKSIAVVENALDAGINFIDTANVYGGGLSEEYIGSALRGKRENVVITTKFGFKIADGVNMSGASRAHLTRELENSLKRLNTDYIDLYLIHFPDSKTPIEETLFALDDAVRQGKVRYIGCSNFSSWEICEAVWNTKVHNLNPISCLQSQYNMIERDFEKDTAAFCKEYDMGIVPYFPLASGFLTGKYIKGKPAPEGTRFAAAPDWAKRYFTEENFRKLASLQEFASGTDHTMTELAMAWLLYNPLVASVIAGATNKTQIIDNAKGGEWDLTTEEKEEVDKLLADL